MCVSQTAEGLGVDIVASSIQFTTIAGAGEVRVSFTELCWCLDLPYIINCRVSVSLEGTGCCPWSDLIRRDSKRRAATSIHRLQVAFVFLLETRAFSRVWTFQVVDGIVAAASPMSSLKLQRRRGDSFPNIFNRPPPSARQLRLRLLFLPRHQYEIYFPAPPSTVGTVSQGLDD